MKYCNNCGSRRRTRRRAIRLLYLTGKIESMKLILASGSPRRKELLEQLINEKYHADEGMGDYLACDIDDLVVEMKNAAEHDVMQQVIVL